MYLSIRRFFFFRTLARTHIPSSSASSRLNLLLITRREEEDAREEDPDGEGEEEEVLHATDLAEVEHAPRGGDEEGSCGTDGETHCIA
jgi:hypothetical protein